ncbi:MAG: tetratricopeptide repeat protein, partial [Candidatus Omnitrophota bacterium]
PVTIKILDLYIKKMRLFSDYELITSSYATTVEGLLGEWYMSLICAVSFFLDRVYDDRAWTGGEMIPTSAEGLGQPGAMIWKAVNPKAETSKAVRGSKVTAEHKQTTFNYHMLGIGFEEMAADKNGIKEGKLRVFLQYPQDYSRIAYLVYAATKAQISFEREFIQPLNIFCLKRLGANILKLKRRSNPPIMYYSFYSLKVVGAGIVIALLRDLCADNKVLVNVFNLILVIILGSTVKVYFSLVFRVLRDLHKHKDLINVLASLLQKGLQRHPNGQERAYKEQVALLKELQRVDEEVERIKENIHKKDTGKDFGAGRNSSPLICNIRRRKPVEPAIVPLPVPEPEQEPEQMPIPEEPLEVPEPDLEPVEAVFAASSLSIRGLWVKIRGLRMNISYGMILAAILAYSVWQTAPPQKAKYRFDLGFCALRQTRYADAISLFQQSLSLSKDPRQIVLAHNGLAFSYEKLGRAKEALKHLKTAFEIDPDYYVTFFICAEMLYKHRNTDDAVLVYAAGLLRIAEPELFAQRMIDIPEDIVNEVILRLAELWNQELEKRFKDGRPVFYPSSPIDDLRLIRLLEARAADALNIIRYNLRFIDDNKARLAAWKFCTDASYIFARALNKLFFFPVSQVENDGFLVEGVAIDFLGKRETHLRICFNYRGRARLIIDPTYAQFDRAYINKIRVDRADMPGPLAVIPLKDYYAELYGEDKINKALDEIMSKLEDYLHIRNSGGFLTDLQLKALFLAKCQLLTRGEIDGIFP